MALDTNHMAKNHEQITKKQIVAASHVNPGICKGALLVDISYSSRNVLMIRLGGCNVACFLNESRHVARDSVGTWCIAKQDASEAELQEALDWACGTGSGQGNIDCSTIQSSGSCYSPDSVIAHASYAFNQYYQKTNQLSTSCDFSGLAQTTNIDPSKSPCIYPSSSSGLSITSTSNSTSSSQFAAPVTSTTPTIPTTTSTPTTATPMTTFGGGNNDSITDMGSTDVGSTNSETPSLATSLAPSHHLCYSFLITCFFFILVSNHKQ